MDFFGIFDIYIEIRDICPKTISGYLKKKKKKKKKTKGYRILGVNYFGNGIFYSNKTNLHDIPRQNTHRQTKYKIP